MKSQRFSSVSLFLLVMVLLIGGVTRGNAQQVGRWEKLGERSVDLSLDKDVISCGHKGSFSTIRFHVEKAPVSFKRVIVKYANGSMDDLNFSQLVPAGANSRYLDLRGSKRVIKQITVYYKAEQKRPGHPGRGKKAKVQIWGRH